MKKKSVSNLSANSGGHFNEPDGSLSSIGFNNSTLVIVNAQNAYYGGALAIPDITGALDGIAKLLARARARQTPVMHLQHVDGPGGLFDPVGHSGGFIEPLGPDNNEYVVQNTMANGFAMSGLDDHLRHIGRSNLIIAGFMTHMGVSLTAKAAMKLGYQTSVVADACAASLPAHHSRRSEDDKTLHAKALYFLGDNGIEIAASSNDIPD